MSVTKPRNRLVNFRLSEEEFDQLRSACATNGARSISDFARSAVLGSISTYRPATFIAESDEGTPSFGRLAESVTSLEARVDQLLALLSSVSSGTGQENSSTVNSSSVNSTVTAPV
ncbi:MAG: hypothetical protein FJW40_16150 [Acidobacteria bacterium]|nr:hypothetical protein [Acidobacteriota bacterium]